VSGGLPLSPLRRACGLLQAGGSADAAGQPAHGIGPADQRFGLRTLMEQGAASSGCLRRVADTAGGATITMRHAMYVWL